MWSFIRDIDDEIAYLFNLQKISCRDNPQAFGKAGFEFKIVSAELDFKNQDPVQ